MPTSTSSANKQVYIVLGMSRSGTSAIARAMRALGIELGTKLIHGKSINPKGTFEDEEVLYTVNRRVAKILGNPWISTNLFASEPLEANEQLRHLKQYSLNLLAERFALTNQWGFKDPRTIAILPFWQEVFKSFCAEDKYIITMRNPIASALSNMKFTKIEMEEALLLWMMILISAIDGTHGKKRVLVSYERMLTNPREQLTRMHDALCITTPLNQQEIDEYANRFLDAKLMHHQVSGNEWQSHPAFAISPLCLKIHTLLDKVAADELSLGHDEFHTQWHDIKQEFNNIAPVYFYMKELFSRNRQLQKEIITVHKSFLWKLSSLFSKSSKLSRFAH